MTTIIYLDNGQSVQTHENPASDIAGLVNAGTQKIYQCTDAFNGHPHYIVVAHIVEVTEQ